MNNERSNVIEVVSRAGRRLIRATDLPDPGTLSWSKCVVHNLVAPAIDNEQKIQLIEDHITQERSDLFVKLILGDFIEMLGTPEEIAANIRKMKEDLKGH